MWNRFAGASEKETGGQRETAADEQGAGETGLGLYGIHFFFVFLRGPKLLLEMVRMVVFRSEGFTRLPRRKSSTAATLSAVETMTPSRERGASLPAVGHI